MDCSEVYFDRNQLVKAFALAMKQKGFTVGWKEDREDPFFVILFVDLPTGQVSWHVPCEEIDLSQWPQYRGNWDLHSTEEKRVRLSKYLMLGG